ncbi:MAG: hypothetical protein JXR25_07270 [Pontiellaceae bacterium]|nr:hypothetical protein [Pontiellaceae bacterium]MBN2784612.1 hypothetical protein [Pontiellaceae bacterium]
MPNTGYLHGLLIGLLLTGSVHAADSLRLSDGALSVTNRAIFEVLAQRDSVPGSAGLLEMKFLIMDVGSDRSALYFMNSKHHEYHFTFARDILGYELGNAAFIDETYFSDRFRKNLAGSIVAYDHAEIPGSGAGLYTLEFWPSDPVAFRFVNRAYQQVSIAMPFAADRLYYHPTGESQCRLMEQELAAYKKTGLRTISTDELFGSLAYQPLNPGTAYGRLVVADPSTRLSARDIVIFRSVPNDLARVAGIITEVPQTPLSHINLKAKQDVIPNAYIRSAADLPEIKALIGKGVRLDISADGYRIAPAEQAELDRYFDAIRPAETQVPVSNLSITNIARLRDIGRVQSDAFGSKSVNVAELRRLLDEGMAPEGFAVPFSMYDRFMKANGLYAEADAMMAAPEFLTNAEVREARLKAFRRHIRTADVPADIMEALGKVQQEFAPDTYIRCRSSANVEDMEGFSGAGLYDSKTHKPDEGHLSKTIKQVWASNWTFRAFEEREFYRIDHLKSMMGVLCHPSYRDELANGVAVTRNLFNPAWRGYYVNVQTGEAMVTNPGASDVPDEFLISALEGATEYEIQYVRRSNRVPEGRHVLSEEQAVELAEALQRIHLYFIACYPDTFENPDFAMEVEFKITAEGKLIFKQARPWVE